MLVGPWLGVWLAVAAASPSSSFDVYFHADLNGRLARPSCDGTKPARADYAALLGALADAKAATTAGAPRPSLTLLGPNQLAPDLFTRQLFADDPARAASDLAALFARAGYGAFTLGSRDLAVDPAWLVRYARAMSDAGVPLVLSNVSCEAGAPADRGALCRLARSRALVDVAGVGKVGVLAALSPRLADGIEASRRQGLVFADPLAALTREAAALRAEGATRVVVMTEVAGDRDGLEELRALQSALGRLPAPPDVVLSAGLADSDGERPVRLMRLDDAPVVAGSDTAAQSLTRVSFDADRLPDVSRVAAAPARADAGAARVLAPWSQQYCARFGQPLGPRVRGIVTREDFVTYVLEVMRRASRAEIAIVNDKLVKAAPFPLAGAISAGELAQALPYRAVLGVARVGGAQLGATVGAALSNPRLRGVGLTNGDGGLKVNGRPIDGTRQYRVATISFVARGGDGIFSGTALPWRPLAGSPDVAALVSDFLVHDAGDEDGDPTIDPATDFGRPASQRLLVVGLTDLELDFADTSISNGPSYTDTQLARAQQTSFKGDWSSLLQTRAPAAETDSRLRVQYGWARTAAPGMPTVSAENLDLVTGSVTYNDRKLRHALFEHPDAAIPDPYARASLESELTRPDVTATQTRTYHHAQLTATAGLLFSVTSKLRLRGGAGAQKELVAPGAAGDVRSVVEAGATLDQVALATVGVLPVKLDGTVDYVLIEPLGTTAQQLRASAHLSVPLLPRLFISAGVDLYGAEYAPLGWAWSADTTVGLRVHLDAAHQRL